MPATPRMTAPVAVRDASAHDISDAEPLRKKGDRLSEGSDCPRAPWVSTMKGTNLPDGGKIEPHLLIFNNSHCGAPQWVSERNMQCFESR